MKTSELQVHDWIPRKQQSPAVKGYYCVFHASVRHLATKGLFFILLMCCDFISSQHVYDFNNLVQCLEGLYVLTCFCNDHTG